MSYYDRNSYRGRNNNGNRGGNNNGGGNNGPAIDFINPYNFIALPKDGTVRGEKRQGGLLTGYIDYTIETKTPLFIPNTTNNNAFPGKAKGVADHQSYDFFSYEILPGGTDRSKAFSAPVIPGSELRGLVRSLYETVTNSCLRVVTTENQPVRRSSSPDKPGLIVRTGEDGFRLCENVTDYALRYDKIDPAKYREGQQVRFTPASGSKRPTADTVGDRGTHIGYLLKGADFSGKEKEKKNYHILALGVGRGSPIEEDQLEHLENTLKDYIRNAEKNKREREKYEEYQRSFRAFRNGEGERCFPVFFTKVTGERGKTVLYLSCSQITKEVAYNTVEASLRDAKPCTDKENACPACRLFGMLNKADSSIASRVRFTDALPAEELSDPRAYFDPVVTLGILGEPKHSATEFYLEKPRGADSWTYDYYTVNGVKQTYMPVIRGRKYYWHQPDVCLTDAEPSRLNRTVRPVKRGVTFRARLYYDGVTARERDRLVWLLNCGTQADGQLFDKGPVAYKLGMGKPLGLGSIICRVESVTERTVDPAARTYRIADVTEQAKGKDYDTVGFHPGVKTEFLTVCALDAVKDGRFSVAYPGVNSGMQIFKWFQDNHPMRGKTVIYKTLPRITEESPVRGAAAGSGASAVPKPAPASVPAPAPARPALEDGKTYEAEFKGVEDGKKAKFRIRASGGYAKLNAAALGLMSKKELESAFAPDELVLLNYHEADGKAVWTFEGRKR